ncbi:MAG TPA: FAD-dependent oxidoreductase, partial [Thermoanaerobaculia bacterium]
MFVACDHRRDKQPTTNNKQPDLRQTVNGQRSTINDQRSTINDQRTGNEAMKKDVLIVGGGVIGLSTAWYLAERGHRVRVVDRGAPSHQNCSYGNAGMLTPSHFVPLSAPGAVRNALRWMFDAESPFYVKPRLDRDLLSWGWKFNRNATAKHVEAAAPLIRDLNLAGVAAYQELARAWNDEFRLVERGILMVARSEHGVEEESRTAALA